MERQDRAHGLAHTIRDLDDLTFRFADALASAKPQRIESQKNSSKIKRRCAGERARL